MKTLLSTLIQSALQDLQARGQLPADIQARIQFDRPKQREHGHFASNVALILAKAAGRKPRELAEALVAALPASDQVERVEIAGPGFINFFLTPAAFQAVLHQALDDPEAFGRSDTGAGRKIQLEFVSANPTGPLHVGHGRGAAYGATLANLLDNAGFAVHKEYYVNDAGRQMDILAVSVWLRYLEALGVAYPFPPNAYQGSYVRAIAEDLRQQHGERFRVEATDLSDLPDPASEPEPYLDALIERARRLLDSDGFAIVHAAGLTSILDDIREDLAEFGVTFDTWFSEKSLMDRDLVGHTIATLQAGGHLYERDGALWFRSTAFGDDKDRVVRRENGAYTYFASDIAYHANKFARGFEQVIDMWGADHHGYVPRVKAALQALDLDPARLEVLLVQFAILYRGSEKVSMSTRAGEFVTLRELRQEVGKDAARFFYVLRRADQHLDFDLELAKSQSDENPVFYIQYAHARIHSVFRQARERGMTLPDWRNTDLSPLDSTHEIELMDRIARFPEVAEQAAIDREPHQIAFYLKDLASEFHTYYNASRFLLEDERLRNARLSLVRATGYVIARGLGLLGVSAPEQM
ncbi:arginine--tRNA ligase [Thermithiobacillus plumbiphilus]|uniref:Arginine--tRNA ligase n=1 Tax=Thermithiobacillus plumbiphilus TaxID=1729899 RepID=A0ABU9D8K6_9PROT